MTDDKFWEKIIHVDGELSKAKIGAVLLALGSIGGYMTGQFDLITMVTQVCAALGIFGVRDAV